MSVLQEAWSIIIDPAHTIAEVFYDLVIYFLLNFLWTKKIKAMLFREHRRIDKEHGYEDHKKDSAKAITQTWGI